MEHTYPTMTSHSSHSDPNHNDSFSSDTPITSIDEDKLGRAEFAKRIAKTIVTRNDPSCLTIGLYGAWGSGKTSMIKMIKEEIKRLHEEDKNASKKDTNSVLHIGIMDFNPWFFRSEEALLQNFLSELAHTIKGQFLGRAKEAVGRFLEEYSDAIALASMSALPPPLNQFIGIATKEGGKKLSSTSIRECKENIEKKLLKNKKKTVVFIDDIDRLDKEEIHALFKTIKLTADFPYVTYVLAFDHDVVTASLQERYCDAQKNAGEAFLEKIIQVPLHMPMLDRYRLVDSIYQKINDALDLAGISLNKGQKNRFYQCFDDAILPKITTLRLSNLYYNALLFSLPLLKGEVCPADLMLIEGVRIFYPKTYECIKNNFYYHLEDWPKEEEEEAIENFFKSNLSEEARAEIGHLQNTFLRNIFPNIGAYKILEGWEKKKRICSPFYFHKYFMYTVPFGKIPDRIIHSFFASLDSGEEVATRELFQAMLTNYSVLGVVRKCETVIDDLSKKQVISFLHFILCNISFIRKSLSPYAEENFLSSLIDLFPALFRMIDEESKPKFSLKLVQDVEPLRFVVPCFWSLSEAWLEGNTYVAPCYKESFDLLAEKVKVRDEVSPLYKQDEINMVGSYLLLQYALGEEEFSAYLISRFERFPEDVDFFLKGLFEWSNVTSVAPKKDTNKLYLPSLIKPFTDLQYIADNLTRRYGKKLDTKYEATDEEEASRLERARAFMSDYKKRHSHFQEE